ncbi:hypothetical protein K7432_003475 [Basidiobolus ranarum]|uniref:Uncharacterized protein n=1 Tax=Basidiobolus ranarum TaxID=34480 RepID=A0ABR2W712_9FUNG
MQNLCAGIKRVLLALFINCILMIFIIIMIALYPGGRLAIVIFHFSLGITCKLIADALFLILRPFDIPVVDSLDHVPCFDMAEEYISK